MSELTYDELIEHAIRLRKSGVPRDVAIASLMALTDGPIDPAITADIEAVAPGLDERWWLTPRGCLGRLRYRRWKSRMLRKMSDEGGPE